MRNQCHELPFSLFKQVLAVSRIMVAWVPVGIAMGVYDMCHRWVERCTRACRVQTSLLAPYML